MLCRTLELLAVRHVFGVPGTQNVPLFEALRRSRLRTVVPTHELAAAFMAGAYYRSSGNVGFMVTIPGPGFAYALTGLAEARLDSAALVHLTASPAEGPGRKFNLQAIEQQAILEPLVKRIINVSRPEEVAVAIREAHALAAGDEPGPVVVQFATGALMETGALIVGEPSPGTETIPTTDHKAVARVAARLRDAGRVMLFVGQGARAAGAEVLELAERLGAPVATTPSGRGTLPEDHPLALGYDGVRAEPDALNGMMSEADLVLILGAKLGHNGTVGFGLRFPPERSVQVDAASAVLGANYPVAESIRGDVKGFVAALLGEQVDRATVRGWKTEEIAQWRVHLRGGDAPWPEPRVGEGTDATAAALFGRLRARLPRDAIVVTDTGRHQGLVRRYHDVLAPGGLLMPSDFQSMGFGLPAAIAAALAVPERRVLAIIGDGGFLMSGLELTTAVRERVALTVFVFSDGVYGQIRDLQLAEYGRPYGVDIGRVPVEGIARALGCRFFPIDALPDDHWLRADGVTVVEVPVGDSFAMHRARGSALAREAARRTLSPVVLKRLKKLLGR